MNTRSIRLATCLLVFAMTGCSQSNARQSQPVQLQATAPSASALQTDAPSDDKYKGLQKIVIHRAPDVNETHADLTTFQIFDPIIEDISNLYRIAQRGGAGIDPEDRTTQKTADLKVLQESGKEKADLNGYFVRLVYEPYIPEAGQNDMGRKDILLYTEQDQQADAYLGIQNPRSTDEWTIIKLPGYGPWLAKELDLLIRSAFAF